MTVKPTYEELEQKNKELEGEVERSKQTEESLRESEERYRGLVETMTDGLAIQNENGLLS